MQNNLSKGVFWLLFIMAIYSCKKDNSKTEAEKLTNYLAQQDVKHYNPYALANMQKAMANLIMTDLQLTAKQKLQYLHGKVMATAGNDLLTINKSLTAKESSKLVEQEMKATHYYIKFMPANQADYAKLKVDSNLIIYPFPLDAAVSEYSGSYRDPAVPVGVPTYQYASVPVNYVLPEVPYIKLADLFLPDESSRGSLVTIKGGSGSSYSVSGRELVSRSICPEIEDDGGEPDPYNIPPEDCDSEYGGGGPSTGTGAPPGEWRPSGRITMNDSELGLIGVEGIKVRARRWFTTYTGITDANGYYHVDGTYSRPANYWLNFERYDFSVNDHDGGPQEIGEYKLEGPWNFELENYDKFCGTIFRAAHHYYYKDIQGLRRPPLNSFWATQVKIGAFLGTSTNNTSLGRTFLFGEFIKIYANPNLNQTSAELYATTIHELAHGVHWQMFNPSMNLGTIVSSYNSVYDNVCDSWARGAQWALTRMVYPDYPGGNQDSQYTNIIIDMIDDSLDYNPKARNGPEDSVTGYTILQLQDALIGANTGQEWKNNIKNLYNNGTEQHLDALFTIWGF